MDTVASKNTFYSSHAPTSSAVACAPKVVLERGQPTPGPLRFCSVTTAAVIRACASCVVFPSGNVIGTPVLFKACPASTFAVSAAT